MRSPARKGNISEGPGRVVTSRYRRLPNAQQ